MKWVVVLAMVLGGCSFVGVERVGRSYRPDATPRCSGTMGPVIADGIVFVLAGMATELALNDYREDETEAGRDFNGTVMVVYGSLVVMEAASAAYGWVHTGHCRDAREVHDRFIAKRQYLLDQNAPGSDP